VDKIIGEHQAVVKPLDHFNKEQTYFSGASVMGDGKLAFILDVNKTISSKRNKYFNLK
jgi:two-component system chemotaxis sensor kinase CheA